MRLPHNNYFSGFLLSIVLAVQISQTQSKDLSKISQSKKLASEVVQSRQKRNIFNLQTFEERCCTGKDCFVFERFKEKAENIWGETAQVWDVKKIFLNCYKRSGKNRSDRCSDVKTAMVKLTKNTDWRSSCL